MIKLENLTDDDLETARRGYRNLLAVVGFLGSMRVVLNPRNVHNILQVAAGYYDDCSVKLVGFDDTFEAYDVSMN